MPAPHVRADYDALAQIAKSFGRQAANLKQTVRRIQRQMAVLQGGDWIGKGARKFYQEMDSEVLPSLNRLSSALGAADRTARKISQIMKQAEQDAARVFRIDGAGGIGAAVAAAVGAAVGAVAALADWQEANPLLARDPGSLFSHSYMSGLIGSQFRGAGSELGAAMNGLLQDPPEDELDEFLETIAGLRGRPVDQIRAEYEKFKDIRDQRDAADAEPVSGLAGAHSSFMGSNTQMRYGSVVGDAFGIDPVFGAMLNPTGGLVGPGNWALPGDDTPVGYHGVVHDAAGYLLTYHGVGPGYDYLGVEPGPSSSPLSGQVSGIGYWTASVRGAELVSLGDSMMSGVRAAADAGSWLFDKAASVF